jgi:hypothetical protein
MGFSFPYKISRLSVMPPRVDKTVLRIYRSWLEVYFTFSRNSNLKTIIEIQLNQLN